MGFLTGSHGARWPPRCARAAKGLNGAGPPLSHLLNHRKRRAASSMRVLAIAPRRIKNDKLIRALAGMSLPHAGLRGKARGRRNERAINYRIRQPRRVERAAWRRESAPSCPRSRVNSRGISQLNLAPRAPAGALPAPAPQRPRAGPIIGRRFGRAPKARWYWPRGCLGVPLPTRTSRHST